MIILIWHNNDTEKLFHTHTGFYVYSIINLFIYINFLFVSSKWKKFYANWTKLNGEFKKLFIIDMRKETTNLKIFRWFYGFLVGSLLSFFLRLLRGSSSACADIHRKSMDQLIFETAYSEQFKVVPYHISIALYFMMADICCTIGWCFNDLFIMSIAIMLHRDFELFNEKLTLNISVRFSKITEFRKLI